MNIVRYFLVNIAYALATNSKPFPFICDLTSATQTIGQLEFSQF